MREGFDPSKFTMVVEWYCVDDRQLCPTYRLDELDLVRPRPGDPPVARAREHLRAATVTLGELGAPTDVRVVAHALVEGFADADDGGGGGGHRPDSRKPPGARAAGRDMLLYVTRVDATANRLVVEGPCNNNSRRSSR